MAYWGRKPKPSLRSGEPRRQATRMMIGRARTPTWFACTTIRSLACCSHRQGPRSLRQNSIRYRVPSSVGGDNFAVLDAQVRDFGGELQFLAVLWRVHQPPYG